MDLTTKAAALTLKNPVLPGSGPMSGDGARMLWLAGQGLGGIVTKTIAPQAAEVGRPCIAGGKDILFNSEAWSEYPASTWVEDFLPALRDESDIPVIASVGYDGADLQEMVPQLEPLVDGYEYIPRYVGKDFDEVGRITGALRKLTKKPVWVKMNGNIQDPVGFAGAARENGADGIVAITSLGPNMVVDIANRRPLIGVPSGFVWTSGPAIKPLALADVFQIKQAYPDLSLIGSGGVSSADDVIEFLLAGADAVQVLTAALLYGKKTYAKILRDLPERLAAYGFSSVEHVKKTGLTLSAAPNIPTFPRIDTDVCTGCGRCADNCPYFAMDMNGAKRPVCNTEKCFGCGLCQTKCPVKAIRDVIA